MASVTGMGAWWRVLGTYSWRVRSRALQAFSLAEFLRWCSSGITFKATTALVEGAVLTSSSLLVQRCTACFHLHSFSLLVDMPLLHISARGAASIAYTNGTA